MIFRRYFRVDERTAALCIKDRAFLNESTETYVVQVRVEDGGIPPKVCLGYFNSVTLPTQLYILGVALLVIEHNTGSGSGLVKLTECSSLF